MRMRIVCSTHPRGVESEKFLVGSMVDVRGLDPGFSPSSRVSALSFLTYSAPQLTALSVKKITNPETFDSLLHPNLGGLYDPALGPTDKQEICVTCGLNYIHCPGHMGHISLPLPVYHPIFFTALYQLLRASCWVCHRLLATPTKLALLQGRLRLLDAGKLAESAGLEAEVLAAIGREGSHTADSSVQAVHHLVLEHLGGEGGGGGESSRNVVEARQWEVQEFIRQCSRGQSSCPHCQAPARALRQDGQIRIFLKGLSKKQAGQWLSAISREGRRGEGESHPLLESSDTRDVTQQMYVSPVEVRDHVRQVCEQEGSLLKAMFEGGRGEEGVMDLFFLTVLPVPASRFRPISQMGERRFENPQTVNLQAVLSASAAIHQLLADREREDTPANSVSFSERLLMLWSRLQGAVNVVMDSSQEKRKVMPNGIKQILEKKEGLFRMNMMGKRVDYAARSVISPDPYINMDEIGIPMVFATKLTYPQPVTAWNVKTLRQAVINGPLVHPGATHVQMEDGAVVMLQPHRPAQRLALARQLLTPSKPGSARGACKKVSRHLMDGDILLMNRQPTLHKPSIMAHKARVLPGEKTMRLHYANCKCYNADFDGDEMNAHFPQNELARSEAYNIVSTHRQYLVPKDGTPLSGLIQDHVVAAVLMTLRGRLFHRHDYHQLVQAALPRETQRLSLLPPCVLRPAVLWSGKQVVSTVLLNLIPEGQQPLNLISKTKINPQEWGRGKGCGQLTRDVIMTESEVVFREGQLLSGVLDKSQLGASQFGFVHSCQELYGGDVANHLLSALGRLFTGFLQLHGFTLGVEDILVRPEADGQRREYMEGLMGCGEEAAAEAFSLPPSAGKEEVKERYAAAHRRPDSTGVRNLDFCFSRSTSKYNNLINTACVPGGLLKPFPANNLQLMVQSGAKGSSVNCMQISCLLGQIELEGQRPPLMPSGRFLPSFLPYDTSPRAGGFVDGRFLSGIRPQEYFFHCMAGREGLVDTAVKTSRSGYLQRCLIKHLEGITTCYDLTVRDSDGSVVQFLYGEDGLDVCHSKFLQPSLFPFLLDNHLALTYGVDFFAAEGYLDMVAAHKHRKRLQRWRKKNTTPPTSPFRAFSVKHLPRLEAERSAARRQAARSAAEQQLLTEWYSLSPFQRERLRHKCRGCPPPALSRFRPDRYFGSIPERLDSQIASFLETLPTDRQNEEQFSVQKFESLIQFKYLRSLAEPGEAVGLLAAQSIGEPSTQMTLNTFHFAGRGEMNVTLGIPRLREILMTASPNIKTPAMEVPLHRSSGAKVEGERLKKYFTRVTLDQVLEKVEVWETIGREGKGHRYRQYKLKLSFLPHHYYEELYVVTPGQVLDYVEKRFVRMLVSAVNRQVKLLREKRLKAVNVERERAVSSQNGGRAEEEEDDEEEDSDREETEVQTKKKKQESSYEAAGDSDQEAVGLPSEGEEGDEGDEGEGEDDQKEEEEPVEQMALDKDRVNEVVGSSAAVVDYSYDAEDGLYSMFTLKFPAVDCKVMLTALVEKVVKKCVVWEVPNVCRGFLSHDESCDQWILKTDGVNLQELCRHAENVELNRVYTNSVHSMAATYGIEAAATTIVREISSVFKVYNIAVDHRHLSLIADYMTFGGTYKPFNRLGLEAHSSPLQKMSFETTMHFLKTATMTGAVDQLASPSACLVTGRVVQGGTGAFGLLQSLT